MGRLLLIRHAQASFLEQNYDKLSAIGETQALCLGEYWVRQKMVFDRVCSGPRVRQKDTARIVAAVYRDAGLPFPEPVVIQEFDEYPADAVLDQGLPGLVESNGEVRNLHRAFQNSSSPDRRRANFEKMFEMLIAKWVDGEVVRPGRPRSITMYVSEWSGPATGDFLFGWTHRGSHGARLPPLIAGHAPSSLDGEELFLQRVPVLQ